MVLSSAVRSVVVLGQFDQTSDSAIESGDKIRHIFAHGIAKLNIWLFYREVLHIRMDGSKQASISQMSHTRTHDSDKV